MTGPDWLAGAFAAAMLSTTGYCLLRMAAAWRWRRPTDHVADSAHALMGMAMAGMLVPSMRVLERGEWEGLFALGAGWFGWLALRAARSQGSAHHLQHGLLCGAMVYMLATASAGGLPAAAAMGAEQVKTAGLLAAAGLLGYVVWTADRLSDLPRVGAPVSPAASASAAPMSLRLAACCEMAMGLTMGYMLIVMR